MSLRLCINLIKWSIIIMVARSRRISPCRFAVTVPPCRSIKKAHQLTDCVPIKEILREPTMSRLRSRRPFVAEAARLASLDQTEQQTWEQSWTEGVPPGHDVVTNPTCPQPEFTLPRRQFVTLNRLRCGQARYMCWISLSMGRDRITCLPLRREPPDHKAHCWRVPTHCIPWRPATSTRSGSRRSGMVIKTVYETVRVFQTNKNIIMPWLPMLST